METDKPKPGILRFFYALPTVVFLFGIVVFSVDVFCFSENFYRKEFKKLGTAEYVGVSEEDVNKVTKVLLDYLKGRRDDISVTVSVNGQPVEFYNDREKAHMVDVRNLYRTARIVGYTGIILLLFFVTLAFVLKGNGYRIEALSGYEIGNAIFLSLIIGLGIWLVIDFESFWISFHKLFFTNDLWLLNPDTDRMINVFEEQLFFNLVLRVAILSVVLMGLVLAGVARYRRKYMGEREQRIENS